MTRRGTLGEPTNPTATVLLIPLVSYVGYRHPVADERDGKVLKIINTETPTEIRWVLQGRLFGPQVTEVKAYWSTANRILKGRVCIVDLEELTFLDKRGRRLLRAMSRDGAQFVASGPNNRPLIEELEISSKWGLSRMITSFLRLSRQ